MRLKQLLGVLVSLLLLGVVAVAATPQLNKIDVSSSGSTTMLTFHATGTFTHTEYQPDEKTYLVDFAGVSSGLAEMQKDLGTPTVQRYRVLSYKTASGAEVTRVELALGEAVTADFKESAGTLHLTLRPVGTAVPKAVAMKTAASVSVDPKPLTVPKTSSSVLAETSAAISDISVQRADNGSVIEINGASNAKAMKLSKPDRLVLDFAGARLAMRQHTISVGSPEVKSVRVGVHETKPLVTRVVVDLAGGAEYKLTPSDGKLLVLVKPAGTKSAAGTPVASNVEAPVIEPMAAEAPKAELKPAVETDPVSTSSKVAPKRSVKSAVFPSAKSDQPVLVAASAQSVTQSSNTDDPQAVTEPKVTTAPKAAPDSKSDEKAQDFTFVEPTVAKKPADSSAFAEPAKDSMPAAVLAKPGPAQNLSQIQQSQGTGSTTSKPKYTGEPISVNLKDVDLKDFFRLIHEISGLNLILDPTVKGSVTLVLDDVPWDQALDIVLRNNNLDRQLDGNVLRIAYVKTIMEEADARRKSAEAQAAAVDKQTVTRFLSYAHAKDVAVTAKKFLSSRGEILADERTNALIISDIPSIIPDIDRLLQQLDRKTQQVEIEVRVVSASRTFARDLGTQLSFSLTSAANTITGSTDFAATSATSTISLANAGSKYTLDAILTLAESRGLAKILSRPRIVTQNNISAMVKQGYKIPIYTTSTGNTAASVSYVDAVLRLTVTPQITVENTIFMAVDVEHTTPNWDRTIEGNPELDTQQATTQVLVTDGGTAVIGGVIETSNSVTTTQTPLLGDIPLLGNLFKSRNVSTSTTELIFFLTPRIVQQ